MAQKILFLRAIICLAVFLFFEYLANGRELQLHQQQYFNNHNVSSVENYTHSQNVYPPNRPVEMIELVAAYSSDIDTPKNYFGLMATMTIFGVQPIEAGQSSGAFITVKNNKDSFVKSKINMIKVGWTANPDKYGDTRNHFFTYWQDGNSGCMDLECNGFVAQSGSMLPPGTILDMVNDLTLKLFKDHETGDWWVHGGTNGRFVPIGYFPNSLFSRLNDKATLVEFGGFITFNDYLKSPPMGSGSFPSDPSHVAATLTGVRFIDQVGEPFLIQENLSPILNYKDCYGLGGFDVDHFPYGGPGGCKA